MFIKLPGGEVVRKEDIKYVSPVGACYEDYSTKNKSFIPSHGVSGHFQTSGYMYEITVIGLPKIQIYDMCGWEDNQKTMDVRKELNHRRDGFVSRLIDIK